MSVIGVLKRKKENLTENKTKTELCIECEKIIADEKKRIRKSFNHDNAFLT